MNIKRYKDFTTSFSEEIHGTIGEYIEELSKSDETIRTIISQHTKSEPWVKITNSISTLSDLEQVNLLKRIEYYLQDMGEVDVMATTSTEITESYGASVMSTFFKCLTALGFKENFPEKETPSEFLFIFKMSNIDPIKVQSVFKRFKSMSMVEFDLNRNVGLYFGIRNTLDFEYGVYHDELIPIGTFKLNNKNFNGIKLSDLKSTSGVKNILVNYNLEDIKLLGKIKEEMENFNPGYFESKMSPIVGEDRIITFGYYGVGKWDNGTLDEGEFMNIKNNLRTFLSKFRWSEKIQISIVPQSFWTYIKIKLK